MKLTDFLNQHSVTIDIDPHEFKFVIDNREFGKKFDVVITYNGNSITLPFCTLIEETRQDALDMFWKEIKKIAVPFYENTLFERWCKVMNLAVDDEINRVAWKETGDYLMKLEDLLGTDLIKELYFHTED